MRVKSPFQPEQSGRSQGISNLWNAMCDTVWSILTIIPASSFEPMPVHAGFPKLCEASRCSDEQATSTEAIRSQHIHGGV